MADPQCAGCDLRTSASRTGELKRMADGRPLLVEDKEIVREAMANALARAGLHIEL